LELDALEAERHKEYSNEKERKESERRRQAVEKAEKRAKKRADDTLGVMRYLFASAEGMLISQKTLIFRSE
jgi:hypothetical protein